MEDMIGKIIELDKQTRENAIKEKELQIDLEQKISDLKEKRRAEYLKRAEGDIKEIEKDEKIKACIKLSAIENAAIRLAANIKKTQKRANALKNITIPKYEALTKDIQNALEEKEREEFTRLKVIKRMKQNSSDNSSLKV